MEEINCKALYVNEKKGWSLHAWSCCLTWALSIHGGTEKNYIIVKEYHRIFLFFFAFFCWFLWPTPQIDSMKMFNVPMTKANISLISDVCVCVWLSTCVALLTLPLHQYNPGDIYVFACKGLYRKMDVISMMLHLSALSQKCTLQQMHWLKLLICSVQTLFISINQIRMRKLDQQDWWQLGQSVVFSTLEIRFPDLLLSWDFASD